MAQLLVACVHKGVIQLCHFCGSFFAGAARDEMEICNWESGVVGWARPLSLLFLSLWPKNHRRRSIVRIDSCFDNEVNYSDSVHPIKQHQPPEETITDTYNS